MVSSFTRFRDHTQQRATVDRTPLDEWLARRRDLYLTTQHTRQTNIHVPNGIRTHDRSRLAAVVLRLRPRGQWDRQMQYRPTENVTSYACNHNWTWKGRAENDPELKCIPTTRLLQERGGTIFICVAFHIALCQLLLLQGLFTLL
jgi:hypothetical protein